MYFSGMLPKIYNTSGKKIFAMFKMFIIWEVITCIHKRDTFS